MTPRRLNQIKREIRVLGIAARQSAVGFAIVGVIYRGNLWLDGVLSANSKDANITDVLAQMLIESPHSGQVRVIIVGRESLPAEIQVSPEELSVKTGKPVILLGDAVGASYTWINGGEKATFSMVGLSRWSAEGVLRASTRQGVTPEALRVAKLTLSALHEEVDA